MNPRKALLITLIGLLAGLEAAAAADRYGFDYLSADDNARLSAGEAIIRPVANRKRLALAAADPAAAALRAAVNALKPNYLSELIAVMPDDGGSLDRLAAALLDVEGYNGIQYWSKRQQTHYDLFDRMRVTSRTAAADGQTVDTVQHMEPFADYAARYRLSLAGDAGARVLYYTGTNLQPLVYYGNVRALGPEEQLWLLYAREIDGKIVFYGVGAFKAFDMFGLIRDRLESSLLGRVEAFFTAMRGKVTE